MGNILSYTLINKRHDFSNVISQLSSTKRPIGDVYLALEGGSELSALSFPLDITNMVENKDFSPDLMILRRDVVDYKFSEHICKLSVRYLTGNGVKKNADYAKLILNKINNENGRFTDWTNIGRVLVNGMHTEADTRTGMMHIIENAESDAMAVLFLATCFDDGYILEQDRTLANKLFSYVICKAPKVYIFDFKNNIISVNPSLGYRQLKSFELYGELDGMHNMNEIQLMIVKHCSVASISRKPVKERMKSLSMQSEFEYGVIHGCAQEFVHEISYDLGCIFGGAFLANAENETQYFWLQDLNKATKYLTLAMTSPDLTIRNMAKTKLAALKYKHEERRMRRTMHGYVRLSQFVDVSDIESKENGDCHIVAPSRAMASFRSCMMPRLGCLTALNFDIYSVDVSIIPRVPVSGTFIEIVSEELKLL